MLKAWLSIPAIIRAIISMFVVGFIGLLATELLFSLNDEVLINIPWSPLAVILFFILYVQYFRGRWWPKSTSEMRAQAMGWNGLSPKQWKWASICVVATFVFVPASAAFSFRFFELPPGMLDRSAEVVGMPIWEASLYIITLSISAGIWEEAAFRGYLQNIIASKHRVGFAIGLSSLIFWVAHFNHSSGPARVLVLLVGAVMLAVLVHASKSIIPGVIGHILSDIYTGFHTRKIINPDYLIKRQTLAETGIDLHFVVWTALMIASVWVFVFAVKRVYGVTYG